MLDYQVNDSMTLQVITSTSDASLPEVINKLHSNRASCVVIIEGNQPVGVVTERDIVRILAEMLDDVVWKDLSIEYFMTSPISTINAEIPLLEAANLMCDQLIRNLPVVGEQGQLIGLLTQANIVNSYFVESNIAYTE